MEDKTLKELKAEAMKLGMSKKDVDVFTIKAPLLATVKLLEANKKNEEIKRVKTLTPKPDPKEEKIVERRWRSKAQKMRDKLDAQPKVRFMIPLSGVEKPGVVEEYMLNGRKEYRTVSGAVETVTLNGCKTLVPKGVFVDLPKQVADVLSDSFMKTQKAGTEFSIDRIDPETGKPVREALS